MAFIFGEPYPFPVTLRGPDQFGTPGVSTAAPVETQRATIARRGLSGALATPGAIGNSRYRTPDAFKYWASLAYPSIDAGENLTPDENAYIESFGMQPATKDREGYRGAITQIINHLDNVAPGGLGEAPKIWSKEHLPGGIPTFMRLAETAAVDAMFPQVPPPPPPEGGVGLGGTGLFGGTSDGGGYEGVSADVGGMGGFGADSGGFADAGDLGYGADFGIF